MTDKLSMKTKLSFTVVLSLFLSLGCSLKLSENMPKQALRQVASSGSCVLVRDREEDVYQIQKQGIALDPIWYDYHFAHKKLQDLSSSEQCQ